MAPNANTPRRVEVSGALSAVRFPSLCASCAATPPAGALTRARMFRRTYSDAPTSYVFAQVRVPFCAACLARHEHDRRPVDPAALRALRWKWLLTLLPYVFPLGVILFLLSKVVPLAVREVGRAGSRSADVWSTDWQLWLILGIVAFFALCLYAFAALAIGAGRPLIAHDRETDPNANDVVIVPGPLGSEYVIPTPPTPTLAAVDFDDEEYMLFESNKRGFTFANPAFAAQFAALNADLVWTPTAPRAVRGVQKRYAATVAVIVLGGAYIAWELLLG